MRCWVIFFPLNQFPVHVAHVNYFSKISPHFILVGRSIDLIFTSGFLLFTELRERTGSLKWQ
jgi:hypothetical protein